MIKKAIIKLKLRLAASREAKVAALFSSRPSCLFVCFVLFPLFGLFVVVLLDNALCLQNVNNNMYLSLLVLIKLLSNGVLSFFSKLLMSVMKVFRP